MKRTAISLAIAGLAWAGQSAQVSADTPAPMLKAVPPVSLVPSSAFFVGVGGGHDASDFDTQNVYAVGTSNVFQNGVLTSSGSAAGPAFVETNSQFSVAFLAQGGYFRHFSGSDWL
jgi:hypothetical protein